MHNGFKYILIMGLSKQIFEQMQEQFLYNCQQVEDGYLSHLDCADVFKAEIDYLAQLAEERKAWLNENTDAIVSEAERYGKEGYKGKLYTKQTRQTLSFKGVPEWEKINGELKAFEDRSKTALKGLEKGLLNVDENGEEIPIPTVNYSSYLKVTKIRG